MAVPPPGSAAAALLKVPGHTMPTESPQRAQQTRFSWGSGSSEIPRYELERTGADRMLVKLFRAGVCALANDGSCVQAQTGQQRIERLLGLDGDGIVIIAGNRINDEVVVVDAIRCNAAL